MAGKTQEGAHRTRFLLGGASEAERERIEKEFFDDEDAFQEMLVAEDDLIDDYARGELSADERKQFEGRFLTSSEGQERVHFARAFAATSGPRPVTKTPEVVPASSRGLFALIFGSSGVLQPALATVALVAIAGSLWLLVERSRKNEELNALRTERTNLNQKVQELEQIADAERRRGAETMAQLNDLRERSGTETPQPSKDSPQSETPKKSNVVNNNETFANNRRNTPPAQDTVTFDLDPGSVRSGPGNALPVPARATYIQLRIALDAGSPEQEYQARIETPEGREVWKSNVFSGDRSASGEVTHVLKVRARTLPPGDYIMFLDGERPNGVSQRVVYSFRLARQ